MLMSVVLFLIYHVLKFVGSKFAYIKENAAALKIKTTAL
ncbi:hypothetical protein BN168_150002 [Clostridioides difficile CD002]|nr:hypothetical protein BN168_150002 [Clostridioides difficile CD002]